MDPTVSHRASFECLCGGRLLTRRQRKFDGYKRSKRPLLCARSPSWRARAHRAQSSAQCFPPAPAVVPMFVHTLYAQQKRDLHYSCLAHTLSHSLIPLILLLLSVRVLAFGSSSCLLLQLPSSSRNIRSRQLYQSANFLIKPLTARGRLLPGDPRDRPSSSCLPLRPVDVGAAHYLAHSGQSAALVNDVCFLN